MGGKNTQSAVYYYHAKLNYSFGAADFGRTARPPIRRGGLGVRTKLYLSTETTNNNKYDFLHNLLTIRQ